ncbi:MAG: crotonase/enoyl-CoA hydratase family protein, partial [Acidimicrobiales bacterium]
MEPLVTYQVEDGVAIVAMDDGKVNALSLRMLMELNGALDQAKAEKRIVVLTGREGVFSAGFDLAVLRSGRYEALEMLRAGFELAERVLAFPTPVVMAVSGHAIAMGLFLVLSGDYRIGVEGQYKLTANEVAIGLTMPRAAVEILRQRLTPAHFNRAVALAETFSPEDGIGAGLLDRVVAPSELSGAARATAAMLAGLDLNAHLASKKR